ncbi:hypothetical protein BGZ63DRAFT_372943 [Mariannaea sp. PMI_226]|nr:hypothetical protein BGZ63DRAFT_372943 [Mariannaea sp. PMI_226]
MASCLDDQNCVNPKIKCDSIDACPGKCQWKNEYPVCSDCETESEGCPEDSHCVYDPRLPKPAADDTETPKVCVPKSPPPCGGFIGSQCPEGLFCYDQPDDGCDTSKGGADCGGICL